MQQGDEQYMALGGHAVGNADAERTVLRIKQVGRARKLPLDTCYH